MGQNQKKLNIKYHSKPVYDQNYLKFKVREFCCVIKTNFLGNEVPIENIHYTCISYINIDFIPKMEKNYLQVYLEACKYKVKKIQISTIFVIIFWNLTMF